MLFFALVHILHGTAFFYNPLPISLEIVHHYFLRIDSLYFQFAELTQNQTWVHSAHH